jgi:hypothetical protein
MEIIQMDGEIQITKRYWWQLYKINWYKHTDLWGGLWWIRFKWGEEDDLDTIKNIRLWLKTRQNLCDKIIKNKYYDN